MTGLPLLNTINKMKFQENRYLIRVFGSPDQTKSEEMLYLTSSRKIRYDIEQAGKDNYFG